MNNEPKSVWKRPIRGIPAITMWMGISTIAIFVVVFGLSLISAKTGTILANALGALSLSVIIVLAVTLLIVVLNWLRFWKNLRRLGFILACLITAVALFYAEENWRGKRAWENYRRDQEAKGEKFERKDFIPAPVPDEQNFAMTPFLAPLFEFKPGTQEHVTTNWNENFAKFQANGLGFDALEQTPSDFLVGATNELTAWYAKFLQKSKAETNELVLQNATPEELAAKVLNALKQADPVLNEIRTASHRPQVRFNIRYENDDPAAILLPHLAALKHLSLVLQLRASARLTIGQTDEAMDDITLMLYLTDTLRREPILISQLVRFAALQLVLQPIHQGMVTHQWSDAQLMKLQKIFQEFNFCADTQFALSAERTFFGEGLLEYFRRLSSRERLRFYDDIKQWPDSRSSEGDIVWQEIYIFAMPTGWYYLEQLNYDKFFRQHLGRLIQVQEQRVDPELVRLAGHEMDQLKPTGPAILHHRLFSDLLLPAPTNVAEKTARSQTFANLAAIACAIERFRQAKGNYPDSLPALVPDYMAKLPHDLIDGQQLRYLRQADKTVLIYSIGWNEKDDGGKVEFNKDGEVNYREGDWVWQLPEPNHQ